MRKNITKPQHPRGAEAGARQKNAPNHNTAVVPSSVSSSLERSGGVVWTSKVMALLCLCSSMMIPMTYSWSFVATTPMTTTTRTTTNVATIYTTSTPRIPPLQYNAKRTRMNNMMMKRMDHDNDDEEKDATPIQSTRPAVVQNHRRTLVLSTCAGWMTTMMLMSGLEGRPPVAGAYEERPVGGENPSAETAAMNRQAIETNNRLEREGFKLETQAEQKASLTAELSSYSYQPSTTSSSSSSSSNNKKKK